RLVEDLLRIVRGLPGREAAVRAVERATSTRRRRAGQLVDHVEPAEPGRDAQVAGLEPEQWRYLAVPPEERHDQRPASARAGGRVRAGAGREQELGKDRVVRVAGLVKLRPAVVVATVDLRTACEKELHGGEAVGHPEKVVAVRSALLDNLRVLIQ